MVVSIESYVLYASLEKTALSVYEHRAAELLLMAPLQQSNYHVRSEPLLESRQ